MRGGHIINLFVLVAAGVMLADMIHNASGTATLFSGMGNLWGNSVNGMLGQTATVPSIQ